MYSRLKDLEFREKLVMMEEKFEQMTKMRIKAVGIFQEIKTKIDRVHYDEELEDENAVEIEIINGENTWLIEGEETITSEKPFGCIKKNIQWKIMKAFQRRKIRRIRWKQMRKEEKLRISNPEISSIDHGDKEKVSSKDNYEECAVDKEREEIGKFAGMKAGSERDSRKAGNRIKAQLIDEGERGLDVMERRMCIRQVWKRKPLIS
ncbi:MAG: hypothetical protein Ta2E_08760 [Mycoplasmoidaceae bacterium]|nr:MAG: hypothetical protein Ta2E_08760 [Mycoplasmoidaceae bacterium]